MNAYKVICEVLEARFSHSGAKKIRQDIGQLQAQYAAEKDYHKRKHLLGQIKAKRNKLALVPNQSYGRYRQNY